MSSPCIEIYFASSETDKLDGSLKLDWMMLGLISCRGMRTLLSGSKGNTFSQSTVLHASAKPRALFFYVISSILLHIREIRTIEIISGTE